MPQRLKDFRRFREKMNERIQAAKNLGINRFFTLDAKAYEDGALDARTKELAGLAASMVLRCDDCIASHVIRCKELGVTITIPHLRRAVTLLEELDGGSNGAASD